MRKTTLSFHYSTLHRKSQYFLCFLAILAVFFASGSTPVSASTNDFYFKSAEFDYYLEKTDTGTKMHVREELTAIFPSYNQNHGITRTIPTTNQSGANPTVESRSALNFSVTRNGVAEKISKTESTNNYITLYIGDSDTYVHGEQTYVLEYDLKNVITEFDLSGNLTYSNKTSIDNTAFQELYWDTNGTGWSQSFNSLTARVHLTSDMAKNLMSGTSCYVGKSGESGMYRCTIDSDDETTFSSGSGECILTFTTINLSAGENLTFAMDFNPGTFLVPEPAKTLTPLYLLIGSAAISLILIIITYSAYRKSVLPRKRFYKDLFTAPQYTPMKDFTVADSAEIYMHSATRSQVATLIELAVNRKVELIKGEKKSWSVKIISLDDVTETQKIVLKILNEGDEVAVGDEIKIEKHTSNTSTETLALKFNSSTRNKLKSAGYLEQKTDNTIWKYAGVSIIITVLMMIGFIVITASYTPSAIYGTAALIVAQPIISMIAILIIILLGATSIKYMSRTEKGLEASNYIEGLKLYIDMAEADRLKFLQSVDGADTSTKGIVKLYEKLLPYAIIFGLEKTWMAELNRYYEMENIDHGWYSGTDLITIAVFNSMVSSTSNTISSAISSSSSSGGGGGGFSGGGGGGGGGGGW